MSEKSTNDGVVWGICILIFVLGYCFLNWIGQVDAQADMQRFEEIIRLRPVLSVSIAFLIGFLIGD